MDRPCTGRGTCLAQCNRVGTHVSCDPNGCYIGNNCVHDCELQRCNNFVICGKGYPRWYLDCHNGCCQQCNMIYGRITFLDDKWDYCSICRIHKRMIRLPCNQECCLECYTLYRDVSRRNNCPLCGNTVWGDHQAVRRIETDIQRE